MAIERPPEELRESATVLQEGAEAGSVLIHVIRPGVGRGQGRHLYEASMLQENAEKFQGWPMYMDHLSKEAKKALGGLPRRLVDTGGVIQESWWDETVPADPDKGWEQGAVVAKVKPLGFAKTLVEEAPEIVGASIATTATGVKAVERNGERVWLVEGISDKGSVDWVTEAGAGGRVVSLVEAAYHSEEEQDMDALETLTDEQIREHLAEHRQELLESLSGDTNENGTPEGGSMEITAEALQEALQEQGIIEQLNEAINVVVEQRVGAALDDGLEGRLEEAVRESIGDTVRTEVEKVVEEERALIHEEAHARASRAVRLRDMRDEAQGLIQESRLPESWKTELRGKFDLSEDGPTPGLDVVDEVDQETGEVSKPAMQVLREAVEGEIEHQRTLLAEVRPTRVRGQGPSKSGDNNEGDKNGDAPKRSEGSLYGAVLQEAGIDADVAWDEKA